MTYEEAKRQFEDEYARQGRSVLDSDAQGDFEGLWKNASADSGLMQGPGYNRSWDEVFGGYRPRIEERLRSTGDRVVDSQSGLADALYGGRPEQRVTSGAGPVFDPRASLGTFSPNADPNLLKSLFSLMQSRGMNLPNQRATTYVGGARPPGGGFTGPMSGGFGTMAPPTPQSAPDYSMGAAAPSRLPNMSSRAQQLNIRSSGQTGNGYGAPKPPRRSWTHTVPGARDRVRTLASSYGQGQGLGLT